MLSQSPARIWADLKGKKVGNLRRGLRPRSSEAGGAIPVSTTGGDMYEALQRKTIDEVARRRTMSHRYVSYEGNKQFQAL